MGAVQDKQHEKKRERKFKFEWDATDDTSQDVNPLYAQPHVAQLYGRGLLAGIDIKEQKRVRSELYKSIEAERRTNEDLVHVA